MKRQGEGEGGGDRARINKIGPTWVLEADYLPLCEFTPAGLVFYCSVGYDAPTARAVPCAQSLHGYSSTASPDGCVRTPGCNPPLRAPNPS